MRYLGGKAKIAKRILSIVLADRKPGQYYVEPFVGGFNVFSLVKNPKIANDINPYVVCLFRAVRDGWEPPSQVSEELYLELKNQDSITPLHSFAALGCSFGGIEWAAYAKGENRNYAGESRRNILRMVESLQGAKIYNREYFDVPTPKNSIIYCDPPYEGTTKYTEGINHSEFWEWCRYKSHRGHRVYISEYKAPKDFICVWEKPYTVVLARSSGKAVVEKLFTYNA